MKTELIHSYSASSLGGRNDSSVSVGNNEEFQNGRPTLEQDDTDCFASTIKNFIGTTTSNLLKQKTWEKKFPVLKWIQEYNWDKFVCDIIAGFTVGLTILPQSIAYATVAGIPPQYGLYSGFVGCFIYIFLGSSKVITQGPTAIVSIVTFAYTHGKPPEYAILLCFLTGIVTFLMGFFQLGFIVNFISTPVNSGFISAAALTIVSTQIKSLLGLVFEAEGFFNVVKASIDNITETKRADAILSISCITTLIILMHLQTILKCFIGKNKVLSKIVWFISTSRNAIIVIVTTIIAAHLPEGTVDVIKKIQPGLPPVKPPSFSIYDNTTNSYHNFKEILFEEGSALIVVPLLCIMEQITAARAFLGEGVLDPNQEMMSIGVTNIVGSFFGSMPVTGSLCRTAVNFMSGAKTPIGGILTGSMVILSLAFLTPYFYYIPKASLAAVIVCAVIFMIDVKVIYPMWKSKPMDLLPMAVTFGVSMFGGLVTGMVVGFLISVIYLLFYAARPIIKVNRAFTSKNIEFLLVVLDRSLTFPSVEYIRYAITKSSRSWGRNEIPVAIDCHHVQYVDFTATQGIQEIVKAFSKRNQTIVLYKAKDSIIRVLGGKDFGYVTCSTENELEQIIDSTTIGRSEFPSSSPIYVSTKPTCIQMDSQLKC